MARPHGGHPPVRFLRGHSGGCLVCGVLLLTMPLCTSSINTGQVAREKHKPGWKSRYNIFSRFVNRTWDAVWRWSVEPPLESDRVAVTIFQPDSETHVALFAYIIRSNMHRLGKRWALQIFYGGEEKRELLDKALGRPANVTWSPINLQGLRQTALTHAQCSWYRLSMDFWGAIAPKYEHVLVFESDSLLLKRNGCVDRYVEAGFDYVGAPWGLGAHWKPPEVGGNGGFSLRRLPTIVQAVQSKACEAMRGPSPNDFKENEDATLVKLLMERNASFPSRSVAMEFAVETVYTPSPCAFHKPWMNLGADAVRTLVRHIDMQ